MRSVTERILEERGVDEEKSKDGFIRERDRNAR
jgi:hypothetical protein